jgi:spore maturation protein SpmA
MNQDGIRETESATATGSGKHEKGVGFPTVATVLIALWLALIAFVLTAGLVHMFSPIPFITRLFPWLSQDWAVTENAKIRNLLVTMFAAGIGSMITTILGYLKHASEKRDFKLSYAPWYFARPLIGVLLGVVFYFVLKGGLLAIGAPKTNSINVYGLGGFATLVGLFSKSAVEKLRDVFGTLFSTEADAQAKLLERLPDDLAKQVKNALEERTR